MLPDINANNRHVGQKRILVGCSGNLKNFGGRVVALDVNQYQLLPACTPHYVRASPSQIPGWQQ